MYEMAVPFFCEGQFLGVLYLSPKRLSVGSILTSDNGNQLFIFQYSITFSLLFSCDSCIGLLSTISVCMPFPCHLLLGELKLWPELVPSL